MRRKTVATVAVVALLATAGCLGFLGGGQQQATTTTEQSANTTTTTTATPTEQTAVENFYSVSGISESGVNETQLARSYSASLHNTSFTITKTRTISSDKFSSTFKVNSKYSGSEAVYTSESTRGTFSFYSNNGTQYTRSASEDTERYYKVNESVSAAEISERRTVAGVLRAGDFHVDSVTTRNGDSVLVLKSDTIENKRIAQSVFNGEPSNFTATVYVTKSGVVKHVEYSAEVAGDSFTATKSGEVTVSNIGSTTVEKPSWVSEAKSNSVVMSVEKTDSYVALTMESGKEIPSGVTVALSSRSGYLRTQLSETVSAGDTVYLTVSDGSLVVSVNEKPSSGSISSDVVAVAFRDNVRYYSNVIGN